MQFKEWLLKMETAGDSWLTPTAQPVARIYAKYYGSAIDGILLPDSLPVDHKRQEEARTLMKRSLAAMKKRKQKNKKRDTGNYKTSDADHGDLWTAFDKQYQKLRPRLPRPQNYNDAPEQYLTKGFDPNGGPDWGTIDSGKFHPMPFYR